MSWQASAAEFDQISAVYDATREPLKETVVNRVAAQLEGWKIRRLVEVGVGTGRVALPLLDRGFEVTGVDASMGMLRQARAKGLRRLIRGDAYRLPLAGRSLDAALFVHVLHILDEPARALAEGCRVGVRGVAALVRPAPRARPGDDDRLRPRRLVIERLRRDGVELPERAAGGPPRAERRFLDEHPPDRIETLFEEDITEPLSAELEMFEKRASRWTLRVPAETMAKAIAEVRAELGDRVHTYHHVVALALWERPPESRPAAGPSSPGGDRPG